MIPYKGSPLSLCQVQVLFSKVHFIYFTETLERRVLIDVTNHMFPGSFSADTGDVNFWLDHV
jgi:hypothetical protein